MNDAITRTLEAEMNGTKFGLEDLSQLLNSVEGAEKATEGGKVSNVSNLLDIGDDSGTAVSSSGSDFAKAISQDDDDEFSNLTLKQSSINRGKKDTTKQRITPILPPPPGQKLSVPSKIAPPLAADAAATAGLTDLLSMDNMMISGESIPPPPPALAPAGNNTNNTTAPNNDDLDFFK